MVRWWRLCVSTAGGTGSVPGQGTKIPHAAQVVHHQRSVLHYSVLWFAAAAAKSLQSCPTLCDPIDGSPPGPLVPGIIQARTLEWVAISFSNAWKWSRSVMSDCLRPHGLQPTRLFRPWDFPGKSTGVGCHCLLRYDLLIINYKCILLNKKGNLCKQT